MSLARANMMALAVGLQHNHSRQAEVAGLVCEAAALAWEMDDALLSTGGAEHYLMALLDAVTPVMEMMTIDILKGQSNGNGHEH